MGTLDRATRRTLVQRGHPRASLSLQCQLLGLSRSALYYQPREPDAAELALMRRVDELYTAHPFYGSRQLSRHLQREGWSVGRRRVRRLMRQMGLAAIHCRPRCSEPHPGHRVHPYLLRHLQVQRAHHVWCADITYIPLQQGYLYLMAVMDWASRCVLAWELSNTLDSEFCVAAVEAALAQHPAPEIFNTDQGSQFTGTAFQNCLEGAGVRPSMDGRGRCIDNVFIERLWRSLKYETVYLQEFTDGFVAREQIGSWLRFYNQERPHSALGGRTPWEVLQAGGEPCEGSRQGVAGSPQERVASGPCTA